MSTVSKPSVSAEAFRVYCTNAAAISAAVLDDERGTSFELSTVPPRFPAGETAPCVLIADTPVVFSSALRSAIENNMLRVIYMIGADAIVPSEASGTPIFAFLPSPRPAGVVVESTVRAAIENLKLLREQAELQQKLERARSEIDELNEIGIALSTQRDTESLLDMILRKSREITVSDAGSLYLVEEGEGDEKRLRFKLTQNDSINVSFAEFSVPINSSSIAGYVALTGEMIHLEDVYQIPPSLPFRFALKFDQESGYRTKSMLVVPMKNPQGEILGVVQLINAKKHRDARVNAQTVDAVVIPYPESRRALVSSLASQAAVAIENNRLYESIEALFEGFVKASVTAIEARDPTTSGHSFRVADLTVGLAEAVDRSDEPTFRDITFNRAEMKEVRYASLLHDFGKVGVREEVLVKAKKLYPQQLDVVRQRFDFVRKALQHHYTQKKLEYVLRQGREAFLAQHQGIDQEMAERLQALDDYFKFVLQCNEPTVLPEGNFQRLVELAAFSYQDWDGQEHTLLTPKEVNLLSIPKGSLDEQERLQIESHVVHTFNFLSQIPWTKEIKNIPMIARAHHEKLNGSGYPYKWAEPEIPFQSKMMTVSDIFDALSASDRPYKKALPTERALDILKMEANQKLIDANIFRLFVEAEIYKKTAGWKHPDA
ncbi:MAG: GAF domain-containing protein [Acidobacteria bacterium]|nr:GAF domain-containing protein [Acidobacteriota bacterium]